MRLLFKIQLLFRAFCGQKTPRAYLATANVACVVSAFQESLLKYYPQFKKVGMIILKSMPSFLRVDEAEVFAKWLTNSSKMSL